MALAVCIIDENLSVPADPRVWKEARALRDAGYKVSVICPRGGFDKTHELLEGIEIYRHGTWQGSTPLGYILEYSLALVSEFCLALRVYARTRFRVLQACNPPDTIFLIALFFKLFGVRFIFDHHDLSPELCVVKFGRKGFCYRFARLAEWLSFCVADVAIATNNAFQEIAQVRGGVSSQRSFVVRTCPDLRDFSVRPARPELKNGRQHLVVYLGAMAQQDGLDLLLESVDYLVSVKGRRDISFALIGAGSEVQRLKSTTEVRGLQDFVKFTGPLYGNDLSQYLATASVGVAPDPSNEFNDKLTMIKILEYMAWGLPVVLYDLPEGRQSAGAGALYARGNNPFDFAEKLSQLLDCEPVRARMGAIGRARIVERLNWAAEKQSLLRAYTAALHPATASVPKEAPSTTTVQTLSR